MGAGCAFPCWPMGPIFGLGILKALVIIAGAVFSIILLIDCLKRQPSDFVNPLTRNGEHDRLIWAAAIVLSFWFFFLGAIVYFFVVKRAQPKKPPQE